MTQFSYSELTIIGIALALVQQSYDKNSSEWRRIEVILERIKEEQCGSDRKLH